MNLNRSFDTDLKLLLEIIFLFNLLDGHTNITRLKKKHI